MSHNPFTARTYPLVITIFFFSETWRNTFVEPILELTRIWKKWSDVICTEYRECSKIQEYKKVVHHLHKCIKMLTEITLKIVKKFCLTKKCIIECIKHVFISKKSLDTLFYGQTLVHCRRYVWHFFRVKKKIHLQIVKKIHIISCFVLIFCKFFLFTYLFILFYLFCVLRYTLLWLFLQFLMVVAHTLFI